MQPSKLHVVHPPCCTLLIRADGTQYAIGVNSCSSAIYLALLAAGVKHGDQVLTNGFTFTALPSTITHAGATPVLVEANENFTMSVDDLRVKIAANPECKVIRAAQIRAGAEIPRRVTPPTPPPHPT
jgi:dTDP-4-amino-4,6-dideoxygalactose transaminase